MLRGLRCMCFTPSSGITNKSSRHRCHWNAATDTRNKFYLAEPMEPRIKNVLLVLAKGSSLVFFCWFFNWFNTPWIVHLILICEKINKSWKKKKDDQSHLTTDCENVYSVFIKCEDNQGVFKRKANLKVSSVLTVPVNSLIPTAHTGFPRHGIALRETGLRQLYSGNHCVAGCADYFHEKSVKGLRKGGGFVPEQICRVYFGDSVEKVKAPVASTHMQTILVCRRHTTTSDGKQLRKWKVAFLGAAAGVKQ